MAKKQVRFDIKKHILVPKHTKLSQKDKKELLSKLKITIKELPKISIKDAAIQDLKPEIGDVIKIGSELANSVGHKSSLGKL